MASLLVVGLEEGLVECATLCVKSWVILMFVSGLKTKVFCRKNKMLKTHNAKMGAECADRLAKNAAKAPKFIGPICLP